MQHLTFCFFCVKTKEMKTHFRLTGGNQRFSGAKLKIQRS